MELKDRLKELRREKGVTVNELAAMLGKAESTFRTWEIGKSNPDVDALLALAEYFNCSVDYLLGKSSMKIPEPDIQMICNHTGLSEKAVEVLRDSPGYNGKLRDVVNLLLENETPPPAQEEIIDGEKYRYKDEDYKILYGVWQMHNHQVLTAIGDYFYSLGIDMDAENFSTNEKKTLTTVITRFQNMHKDLAATKATETPSLLRQSHYGDLVDNILMQTVQDRIKGVRFDLKVNEAGEQKRKREENEN